MRLLTFTECKRRLDPDGGGIVTESWLRRQLPSVKVGKRHLVPEPKFIDFCRGLLDQCQGETQAQESCGAKMSAATLSAGTKAEASASVQRAQTTINALLKPSAPILPSNPSPAAQVVPINSKSRMS